MIRNFKALGLALVAIFAMSAMAASAASAQQGKLTAPGPFTLHGEEVAGGNGNALTSFSGETRCPGSTYTGHKVGNSSGLIASGATTVTLTPHYNQAECVSVSGGSTFSSTVDMNGCDYVLHLGSTTQGKYGVTADVVCPAGAQIQLTQFSGEAHGFRVCSVTVGPQTGLGGAHVTDQAEGHLLISGTFLGVKATRSGLCGSLTTETGEFHINATVDATDELGEPTEVNISE